MLWWQINTWQSYQVSEIKQVARETSEIFAKGYLQLNKLYFPSIAYRAVDITS